MYSKEYEKDSKFNKEEKYFTNKNSSCEMKILYDSFNHKNMR